MKSTNVRIEGDAARSLGLALAAWGALVGLAVFDGVFSRLPAAVDFALAVFAALLAAATYALDASVRARIDAAPGALLAFCALAADAPLGLAAFGGAGDIGRGALAWLAFFVAPLGLAAHVALLRRLAPN
jgi:hypothetical protein